MLKVRLLVCASFCALLGQSALALDNTFKIDSHRSFDGVSDDLFIAGLGIESIIAKKTPDPYKNPLAPTAAELRQRLVTLSDAPANGFGRNYGPNVDPATEKPLASLEKLAGDEYRGLVRTGPDRSGVLLQVPKGFSAEKPCLVAISTAGTADPLVELNRHGYWGLTHSCAVVWSDKGAGAGAEIVKTGQALGVDGLLRPAGSDMPAKFATRLTQAQRDALVADRPGAMAYKWAHAGWSNEEYAGEALLNAIRFGFQVLNQKHAGPRAITPENTVVIATGHSGGGGGAVQAAEQDMGGLIDGVVARAPQIQTYMNSRITIEAGGREASGTQKDLANYFSFADLYRPCAVLAVANDPFKDRLTQAATRCESLAKTGDLESGDLAGQSREALEKLHSFGFDPKLDIFIGGTALFDTYTYGLVSQYGGFGVAERLCRYSISAVTSTGTASEASPEIAARLGDLAKNGKPDGTTIALVNDADPAGPTKSTLSASASSGRKDYNLDGNRCLRDVAASQRVKNTLARLAMRGDLHGKPTIIVQGQVDEILPVDMVVRPYLGLNALVEGDRSRLSYIEIPLAGHGDAYGPYRKTYAPWGVYHIRALEMMWNTLTKGGPLPPSQIVRVGYSAENIQKNPEAPEVSSPPIQMAPRPEDVITIAAGRVTIPD